MRFKQIALLLCAMMLVAMAAAWVALRFAPPEPRPGRSSAPAAPGESIVSEVYLYFGDPQNEYLSAEIRSLSHSPGPLSLSRAIVEAIIAGPASNRTRTIPEQTVLDGIYIDDDATAFVDLSPAMVEAHPGGAHSELMTVFSIVNSLILNVPQIKRVKLMIGGTDASSLAGHIDLRHPLTANMLIVR